MLFIEQTTDSKIIATLNREVQELHCRLYPDLFKPYEQATIENALRDHLEDPDCFAYLARKDGMVVGYAVFFIRDWPENAFHYARKTLYIDQICVHSEHRNTGAGKLLLKQAETLAKEHSAYRIELEHWSANADAAIYFRKNGFNVCRERLFKAIR